MTRATGILAVAVAMGSLAIPGTAAAWDRASRPEEGWTFPTFRLTYGYTFGTREGTRIIDRMPVSVDYVDHVVGGEVEIEDYDARRPGQQRYPAFLGVALGIRFVGRFAGVASWDWEQPTGVLAATGPSGWAAPFRFSLAAGTLAQLVRETEFVLAIHASIEFQGSRSTWTQDVGFAIYPGLRMVWQPDPVRVQLGYDFVPIYIGQARLEHRPTAAVAFQLGAVGLGVRFTAIVGTELRGQRTYDDVTLGGALELTL